ncbi:helix-turn-helix domain-containing protein [Providencia rettgeri]|uniref:helix-turn-helix domain-containing protein n=1 Tax=Providencia rettgeri TaxID=587 RepID=UPI0001C3470F|nr:helix-turn-helix transcriptional regulator [Providencia rettgeri]QXA58874.1 helix-turn-helix domain-containing protein [Providencia rettgeri]
MNGKTDIAVNVQSQRIDKDDISRILHAAAQELIFIRRNKGLSGSELGKKIGVSQQQISRYERNVSRLDFGSLIYLLHHLDMPLSDFLYHVSSQLKTHEPLVYSRYYNVLKLKTK